MGWVRGDVNQNRKYGENPSKLERGEDDVGDVDKPKKMSPCIRHKWIGTEGEGVGDTLLDVVIIPYPEEVRVKHVVENCRGIDV